MNFGVLILGSDPNAYYMARSYHELYGKRVDMMSVDSIAVTRYSKIINFFIRPKIYTNEGFVDAVNDYASKSYYEKIILIATNDKYVRLLVENQTKLNKVYVFNYPKLEILNKLLIKENFYQNFHNELDIPKTFIYSCLGKPILKDDFVYPVILKPGNGVEYYKHSFPGMSKVYKPKSFDELKQIIKKIEDSGYQGNLIIQEYIVGEDTTLYDIDFYCGKEGKVQLISMAQIGLEEKTHTGIGNCTVLVNGFDENGYKEEIILKMKSFIEKLGYTGFGEIDLKYDNTDKKYKILEINSRQARSSYYLTACGQNLIKYLVDDLIYNKPNPFLILKEEVVLSFVPKYVIRKYVKSIPLQNKIKSLIKSGKFVRPLHYSRDNGIKRKIYLLLKDLNYINKYKKLTW